MVRTLEARLLWLPMMTLTYGSQLSSFLVEHSGFCFGPEAVTSLAPKQTFIRRSSRNQA